MTNTNTSATGGILVPAATPAPLEGAELEDFFQSLISEITQIDGHLVRPRWQPEPPALPQRETAVWCAFGFEDESSDFSPTQAPQLNESGNGFIQLRRNEVFKLSCSFYGTGAASDAKASAKLLRDGLSIGQNRESFTAQGMGLLEVSAPIPAPSLAKEIWLYRCDLFARIRRLVVRDYPILSLDSASGTIVVEQPNKLTINVQVSS